MLRQARSGASRRNPQFQPLDRASGETNTQWGARAVAEMRTGASDQWSYIVLLGGSDSMAFRLRVAQSHLRGDMLPSYWSNSILVQLQGNTVRGARAIHVPLIQPEGPEFSTRSNGVVDVPLTDFDDPKRFPNIAVVAMPVPQDKLLEQVEKFRRSRSTLDALEHVLRWLAFAWGSARTPNPLHDNYGLPSACMLETVCAAASFDLTPGLEARASCPEAIWAAALYWQDYFKQFRGEPPIGRYTTPHEYAIELPDDEPSSPPAPSAPPAAAKRTGGAAKKTTAGAKKAAVPRKRAGAARQP